MLHLPPDVPTRAAGTSTDGWGSSGPRREHHGLGVPGVRDTRGGQAQEPAVHHPGGVHGGPVPPGPVAGIVVFILR